jgi:hypothetical protein
LIPLASISNGGVQRADRDDGARGGGPAEDVGFVAFAGTASPASGGRAGVEEAGGAGSMSAVERVGGGDDGGGLAATSGDRRTEPA